MAHLAGTDDGEIPREILLLPVTDMDLRPSDKIAGGGLIFGGGVIFAPTFSGSPIIEKPGAPCRNRSSVERAQSVPFVQFLGEYSHCENLTVGRMLMAMVREVSCVPVKPRVFQKVQ